MVQVPLINGIYADAVGADVRTSYPRNYIPVPKETGIAQGYLRPAYGIAQFADGSIHGTDRGGINWNGVCYRVMGTHLVTVSSSGAVSISLGKVIGSQPVTFFYSFSLLAIVAAGNVYYFDGTTFTQVTDVDLGSSIIHGLWIDGYFALTDGNSIIVNDLADPFSINPLKYGSSEADPDSIKGLAKIRNELHAVNRYTVEVFQNVGGNFFPFQRIPGALFTRGAIGTKAFTVVNNTLYFLGSGKDEPPAIWAGVNGTMQKVSSGEIDKVLRTYTETQLADVIMETIMDDANQLVYIHLPDRTYAFDVAASAGAQEPVWFILTSGIGFNQYRVRNIIWCYNRWIFGDPQSGNLGTFDKTLTTHYGTTIDWEFGTIIVYAEGLGALMYDLELVGIFGSVAVGANPVVLTSMSTDGSTFGTEFPSRLGKQGERSIRVSWMNAGNIEQFRVQKFRGFSDSHASFTRLNVRLEALYV